MDPLGFLPVIQRSCRTKGSIPGMARRVEDLVPRSPWGWQQNAETDQRSESAGHQASSHQIYVNGAWQSVSRFTSIGHQRANPASEAAIGSTGSRAVGPNGSEPPRAS